MAVGGAAFAGSVGDGFLPGEVFGELPDFIPGAGTTRFNARQAEDQPVVTALERAKDGADRDLIGPRGRKGRPTSGHFRPGHPSDIPSASPSGGVFGTFGKGAEAFGGRDALSSLGLDLAKSGAGEAPGRLASGAGDLQLELGNAPAGFALESIWVAVAEVAGLGLGDGRRRRGTRCLFEVAGGNGLLDGIEDVGSLVESVPPGGLEGDFAVD